MPVQRETSSNLWLFESHSNTKRTRWLQSTLSELEEKIKEMLKLTECEADTFSQRAEMYYKRRPELAIMIEDFYRSYRSLAEKYDQIKLESGNSFSNRVLFRKQYWSFIDRRLSASSDLTFESEFEMDDQLEEDQVHETKSKKLPRDLNDDDDDDKVENNTSGKSSESCFENLEVYNCEREQESDQCEKLRSEVERLEGENASFEEELERKDEEKREVIRQLTSSIDILKRDNDSMRKFIKDSKNQHNFFEFRKLMKKLFSRPRSKFPVQL